MNAHKVLVMAVVLIWMLLGIIVAAAMAGCVGIAYTAPTGEPLTITRFAVDTQVGELTVVRADGTKLVLKQYNSENVVAEKALDLATETVRKIP